MLLPIKNYLLAIILRWINVLSNLNLKDKIIIFCYLLLILYNILSFYGLWSNKTQKYKKTYNLIKN